MIVRTTRTGTIIERFENRLSATRSDENDEEMEVMRPVDSFFDRTKSMTISVGTIIEYQGKIFGDYCNKYVITEIKDEVSSRNDKTYLIKIYKLFSDGMLSQGCWINYNSDIIEVLSEEQFVTLGKWLLISKSKIVLKT